MIQTDTPAKNLAKLTKHYSISSLRPYPASEEKRTRPLIPFLGYQPVKASDPRREQKKDTSKNKKKQYQKSNDNEESCGWCGRSGHTESHCRKKKAGMSKADAKAAVQRATSWRESRKNGEKSPEKRSRKCNICGSLKHLMKECPKKDKTKVDEGFSAESSSVTNAQHEESESREAKVDHNPSWAVAEDFWMMHDETQTTGRSNTSLSLSGVENRPQCLRATVNVNHPIGLNKVVAGIDSFSSRTFCLQKHAIAYEDLPPKIQKRYAAFQEERPISIRGCGSTTTFDQRGYVCIMKHNKKLVIPALVTTSKFLPRLCGILLGIDAISEHRIDVNAMVKECTTKEAPEI